MSLPEDQNLPDLPIIPDENASSGEPVRLPPARRRRLRRTLNLPGGEERAHILERLGRRAFPAFEFFLFALLCGAILGAGYLLDSHSLLLLGILLAPLMTPWVGLTLSMATGSWRFFFMTLAGLILGFALIFLGGFLAGLVARTGPSFAMSQATNQAHLWWPNLGVLALGAVLLVASFVRSEEKPLLASAMVAYELYLPLSAAGYGLGRGTADIWPNAMLVFVFHFALAVLLGMITLFVLRFRPSKFFGYLLPVTVILVSLVSIFFLSGLGNILSGFFSPQPVALPTLTAAPATATFASSSTPLPTVRGTEPATSTPTLQLLATPTPLLRSYEIRLGLYCVFLC